MNFSRQDFERNAMAMISAFNLADKICETGPLNEKDPFALCDWRLHHGDNNTYDYVYLSHPLVNILSNMTSIANDDAEYEFVATRDSDDILNDESITIDDQCYIGEIKTDDKRGQPQQFTTQWMFTIIYSDTYQVPVLYFNVQEMNGNPVGRQLLLRVLQQEHQRSAFESSNDFPVDTWEFISQEQHPVTGICSFFLHPCQSAQRLQLLISVSEDLREVCMELEQESIVDGSSKNGMLWAWMSMILPAVGQSIPSFYFRHIQKCIESQP
mmetsp:Transcript_24539/g.52260  ORF Transcript_24539/g.52260 Transcript_24539/m.52260 type:complete len:269 (-) Transcript_24539:1165-1971(-)